MPKRLLLLAALLALPGCASWNADKWDLSRYRDPRAADIDARLTDQPIPVANPFGVAEDGG